MTLWLRFGKLLARLIAGSGRIRRLILSLDRAAVRCRCAVAGWIRRRIRHRGQVRLAVLGRAHVAVNVVLADLVDDHFDGLRAAGRGEHDRLVEIDVLLRQGAIVDQQFEVGKLMLTVGFLQANLERPRAAKIFRLEEKALRLDDVELDIVALALFSSRTNSS